MQFVPAQKLELSYYNFPYNRNFLIFVGNDYWTCQEAVYTKNTFYHHNPISGVHDKGFIFWGNYR